MPSSFVGTGLEPKQTAEAHKTKIKSIVKSRFTLHLDTLEKSSYAWKKLG
jgi:hypothetical protein